jgi:hypothetical protein
MSDLIRSDRIRGTILVRSWHWIFRPEYIKSWKKISIKTEFKKNFVCVLQGWASRVQSESSCFGPFFVFCLFYKECSQHILYNTLPIS